jgi:hypothetical protein
MFHRVRSQLNHYMQPELYHHYLGDALLHPENFAAKFLKWLIHTGNLLLEFAAGPPGLENMSRIDIKPIPAENFSVPHYIRNSENQAEFWPKICDLVPESWIVLVSREEYVDKERDLRNRSMNIHLPREARYVKYALVRPLVHIAVDDPMVVANLRLEQLEVGGLKEFLRATAPGVDSTLVDQRLAEAGQQIGSSRQAPLPSDLKWLMVMEHDEAIDMLREFLTSALQWRSLQTSKPGF